MRLVVGGAGDAVGGRVRQCGGGGKGEAAPIPLLWNRQTGKGRVHVNILGHYNWTFNDPLFRILLLRAIAWAAKEPVDRFNDLATIGTTLR